MGKLWKVGDECAIAYPDEGYADAFPKALLIDWQIKEFVGDLGAVHLVSLCGYHTAGVNVEWLERITKRGQSTEYESSEYTKDDLMKMLNTKVKEVS